jgi:Tfp pilus assembly protein PilV
MRTCEGLSLTEVLVSLVLVTSASLAFIEQQCHITQFTNQLHHRQATLLQLDNVSEQMFAGIQTRVDSEFSLVTKSHHPYIQLDLAANASRAIHLTRWMTSAC